MQGIKDICTPARTSVVRQLHTLYYQYLNIFKKNFKNENKTVYHNFLLCLCSY